MQTKRSKVTEQDVERWTNKWLKLREEGVYKPWLEVREVPSKGRSRKVKGIKMDHTHHFLSDLEYHTYLLLEFDPSVTGIYDQYPLLPRDDSIIIANELGIRHPVYPQSSTPIVLTTDFLFDYESPSGNVKRKGISVKPQSELNIEKKDARRTLHKMELEKLVNAKNDIELKCVTEKSINKSKIYNLKWFIHDAVIDAELDRVNNTWLPCFKEKVVLSDSKLIDLLKLIAKSISIRYEDSVRLYRHNMWNQNLKADLDKKIQLTDDIGLHKYSYN